MARENVGWGARRIVGEFRTLGIAPSRSVVRRLLNEDGLLPDPDRRAPKGVVTPWRNLIAAHAESLVSTDFFCKRVWTTTGVYYAYMLVFIHIGSRKVFVSPATFTPDEDWVKQQGRNALMWAEDEGFKIEYLIRDRDTKFTTGFDSIFTRAETQIVRTPIKTPEANAYAESWIGHFKRECLNHFICFSLPQLNYITQEYEWFYNRCRPHQGIGNVPIDPNALPPERDIEEPLGSIGCEESLGGILKHYYRQAA